MIKRTIVYVDGFNLYYGSLKNSPYKWLDLKALFFDLLEKQHSILEIKYFTARISPRKAGDPSPNRQKIYILAIQKYIPELKVYYGHYLTNKIQAKVCNPINGVPKYIEVYKTEEKGSDVNIALHILNDAWLNKYDSAVLVSNDSDIVEALRFVTQEHKKEVGLIVPGNEKNRRVSNELKKYSHFIKRISPMMLEKSQLPDIIGANIEKPKSW